MFSFTEAESTTYSSKHNSTDVAENTTECQSLDQPLRKTRFFIERWANPKHWTSWKIPDKLEFFSSVKLRPSLDKSGIEYDVSLKKITIISHFKNGMTIACSHHTCYRSSFNL